MEKYDPRIDTYIDQAAEFAQPILKHIRALVHEACPEISETMKWSFPHFDYKGTVCSMAAFKNHCSFGFWKSTLLPDPKNILRVDKEQAMGQLGRITSIAGLPDKNIFMTYIQNAVILNKEGIKMDKKPLAPKTELHIPEYFSNSLAAAPDAQKHFEQFSYSQKKEYLEWITEAKSENTRHKRLTTALEWIAEGKSRNWKYQR
ncbi:YdeI/OmpD-associated family protein [Pedobacter sp. PLR]|uniref:YdeI/OmpD-associated family protein n=1 Tax=Pedobacter sp. PLR TaxID=2994465 RepID=UPI002245C532|nr:YdeI/OmpD-associated family protein [Pedobacter sp. PLR]MCX2453594.1 YdeI/OmpD-associated family protein [Pedobacter sp. PLR]